MWQLCCATILHRVLVSAGRCVGKIMFNILILGLLSGISQIHSASLVHTKDACPDQYCTSKTSQWEGEAVILDKLSSNMMVVNFSTEKILSFQVWNESGADSFQLITEWDVKANRTGLQRIYLHGNTFYDGRYWYGVKLPLRSSDNFPLPVVASCNDSTLPSYKFGPGSLSTGETYVFGGAHYPFTLLIRLTNTSEEIVDPCALEKTTGQIPTSTATTTPSTTTAAPSTEALIAIGSVSAAAGAILTTGLIVFVCIKCSLPNMISSAVAAGIGTVAGTVAAACALEVIEPGLTNPGAAQAESGDVVEDRELRQFIEEITKVLYAEQKILCIFLNVGFTRSQIEREIHAFNHKKYKYEEAAKSLLIIHFNNTPKHEGMEVLRKAFHQEGYPLQFDQALQKVNWTTMNPVCEERQVQRSRLWRDSPWTVFPFHENPQDTETTL